MALIFLGRIILGRIDLNNLSKATMKTFCEMDTKTQRSLAVTGPGSKMRSGQGEGLICDVPPAVNTAVSQTGT